LSAGHDAECVQVPQSTVAGGGKSGAVCALLRQHSSPHVAVITLSPCGASPCTGAACWCRSRCSMACPRGKSSRMSRFRTRLGASRSAPTSGSATFAYVLNVNDCCSQGKRNRIRPEQQLVVATHCALVRLAGDRVDVGSRVAGLVRWAHRRVRPRPAACARRRRVLLSTTHSQ
jgi:hypothetical protein